MTVYKSYGSWSLVTGASSGIGASFGRHLAKAGQNVVLVARRAERLEALSKELTEAHGVEVRTVSADLATVEGIEGVFEQTKDLEIGLLVSNAGRLVTGSFLGGKIEDYISENRLNIDAHLRLSHHYGRLMAARGRGGILLVGSMGGFMGNPFMANYAATKAHLVTLTLGLSNELKDHGVDMSIVTPGSTDTEMTRVQLGMKPESSLMSPEQVVEEGLAGLPHKPVIIPGFMNRIIVFVFGMLPRTLVVKLTRSAAHDILEPEAFDARLPAA